MEDEEGQGGSNLQPVRKLVRSSQDKWFAGVCGGLGTYFQIDSNLIRVLFAVSCLFGGAGLAVYIALWVIMPMEGESESLGDQFVKRISDSGAAARKGEGDE